MCSIYCLFNHSLGFLTRNTCQVLFNFCEFCNFQGDPALQEDWKSTVCLRRKMSQSTLCFLCFLPIAPYRSFFSFLLSFLYSFSLFIFLSLFYFLNFPWCFLYTLYLLFFTFSSFFIFLEANSLSWSHTNLVQMLVLRLSVPLDKWPSCPSPQSSHP